MGVKNENLYHDFCNDRIEPIELYNYFKSLKSFSLDAEKIKQLIYPVFLTNVNNGNFNQYCEFWTSTYMDDKAVFKNDADKIRNFQHHLSAFYGGGNRQHNNSINYSIYQKLESWRNIFDRE